MKKVTAENITQEDIDFLNSVRLGIMPIFDKSVEAGQSVRNDMDRAKEFAKCLAAELIGDNPLNWHVEELATLDRSLRKFKEICIIWQVIYNNVLKQVNPKKADFNGVITKCPPAKSDARKTAIEHPVTPKKRLSAEEKTVEGLKRLGLPPAAIAATLAAQGITQQRIQEILK